MPEASGGRVPAAGAYWKANLAYLAVLLSVWFAVSYLGGIVFVKPLNAFKVGGAPLGFWIAQQGSIYVFLVLILVYTVLMNALDRKHDVREA